MLKMINQFYSQPQDVLTDFSKDRLVNLSRHKAGTTGGGIANTPGRDEQVRRGQEALLQMETFEERRDALRGDMDIHLEQQQGLRKMFGK